VLKAAHGKGIDAKVRRHFTDALNAYTVTLTQKQALAMAQLPQVAYVQRSELRPLQTDRGPEFIGAKAVWSGGASTFAPYKGDGIVVGIVDTGSNTDHPSFAAIGGDGYHHVNPLGAGNYLGDCATGHATCNDKLIGVWSWPVITDSFDGVRPPSGEDYNGHGSHTASTVAGNVVNNVPLLGSSLGDGDGTPTGFTFAQVSGVAPHANIVAYQVCFPTGGCPDEAILTAVDPRKNKGGKRSLERAAHDEAFFGAPCDLRARHEIFRMQADPPAGLAFIRRKHWRRFLRQYWRHRQTRCGSQETTSIESHDWSFKPNISRNSPLRHENGSSEPTMRQKFGRNACLDWS